MERTAGDSVEAAREAFKRCAWKDAFDLYSLADAGEELDAGDLEAMGQAAFWLSQPRDCIRVRERAVAAYTQAGDSRGAARVALGLVGDHFFQHSFAIGGGWFRKAQRLLEDEPDSPELRT